MIWILPLDSDQAVLETAGGKGASLSGMALAGLPVPEGFLLTTQAYRDFVAINGLETIIQERLAENAAGDLAAYEAASQTIRAAFADGKFPPGLQAALEAAFRELGEPPCAVRSSATAEDLPGLSFAGQQDTFLNITRSDALIKAVVDCWSSLWTARAIQYRARNGVDHGGAALAVVVQRMVESQVSGVMFTANPLTGRRSETVIDATYGLGEALVSGQVEPDHYVVAGGSEKILERHLGAKALAIHGRSSGGTQVVHQDASDKQALPDEQIVALAQLGQQAEAIYGVPQDVEWAYAGERLYILQSRPVTSLYPTLEGIPPEPLKVYFSFAAVQGMMDPVTPLGGSMLKLIFARGASLFGIHVTGETQTVLATAGERLWVHMTSLLQNSFGRKVIPVTLELVEPTVGQAVKVIWEEPQLQPSRKGVSLHARMQLARFFIPLAGSVLANLARPSVRRNTVIHQGEKVLEKTRMALAAVQGEGRVALAQRLAVIDEVFDHDLPATFRLFVSGVAAGMSMYNLLNVLAKGLRADDAQNGGWDDLVLEISRGLPNNPTTEMDLALWRTAQVIRSDPASWSLFQRLTAADLAARYRTGDLPAAVLTSLRDFLARYGGRGLGEIDMGRPRWGEDPTPVFEMLAGTMQIEDSDQAPDVVFIRGAERASQAVEQLAAAVRRSHRGWVKVRLVRFAARRVRELLGLRESPKFFAVRLMALARTALLKSGADLVRLGDLEQAEDVVYLSHSELGALSAGEARDWRALVLSRREAYARELMRRQVPRLLLSDGRAFYDGMASADGAAGGLNGSPVSPGSITGRVRVVFDPRSSDLQPGEILVCPGTDPSWTPLFLTAAGLIMEVGGMMTHGAVVAREYGIPAVVGVHQATERLHTGQRVRLDGSSGLVTLLED